MKKSVRIVSLALACLCMLALIASCGKDTVIAPNKDAVAARDALEDKGYPVFFFEGTGASVLADFYGVDKPLSYAFSTQLADADTYEALVVLYFTNKEDAKAVFESEDFKDKVARDQYAANYTSDWVFNQTGSLVYFGTENAVMAAK